MHLEERFEEVLNKKFNITRVDRILLAVSGGKDSMSLLHLCASLDYSVAAAHCNFSLRGDESDQDALFVKEICERKGISFYEKKFDTMAFAHEHKMGIQEAARILRYSWFDEVLATYAYDHLLTAHHANDVAETILMNMARGSGIRGLRGISPQNGRLIRPLLFLKRKEIDDYVNAHHIAYREDSSNATDHYTRNYVRHHIIPFFEQINDQFVDHMIQLASHSYEAQVIIDKTLDEFKKHHVRQEGSYTYISIKELLNSPAPSFYLYELLYPYEFNLYQVESVISSLYSQSGHCFLSASHQLIKDRSELIICPLSNEQIHIKIEHFPFDIRTHHYQIYIEKADPSIFPSSFEKNALYLDLSGISEDELFLRNWLPGDRFTPLGMIGSKKISDYLIDKKIPVPHKKEALVLVTKKDIVALLPYQIDEHYKINSDTSNFLRIRIEGLN